MHCRLVHRLGYDATTMFEWFGSLSIINHFDEMHSKHWMRTKKIELEIDSEPNFGFNCNRSYFIWWTCFHFETNHPKPKEIFEVFVCELRRCVREREREIKTYQASVGFFFGGSSRRSRILIILIRRICTFIEIPAIFGSHCNKQLQKQ